jgi:Fe-S cluster assembly ATP-binding protein
MIKIEDLTAEIEGKPILKGFNLAINAGEIHAIMGPNGAGKSTLAKVLAGHPSYEVTGGSVWFKGQDLLEMEPEERSRLGLFMSFQYPVEVAGVSNRQFLFSCVNARRKTPMTEEEFEVLLDQKMEEIQVKPEFKQRNINEGFSGGEKKRNEILQMALLEPDFAILDETDSGLDIDAMKTVANGVLSQMNPKRALLVITHYQRLLNYIKPDKVHVMVDGKIVQTGDFELAKQLEAKGYDWVV